MRQIYFHAVASDWEDIIRFMKQRLGGVELPKTPSASFVEFQFPGGSKLGCTNWGLRVDGTLHQSHVFARKEHKAVFDRVSRYIIKISKKGVFGYIMPNAVKWHEQGNKFAEEIPVDVSPRVK